MEITICNHKVGCCAALGCAIGGIVLGGIVISVVPVIGAIGLGSIVIRTIYDIARLLFARCSSGDTEVAYQLKNEKIEYYSSALKENILYARVFLLFLLPILGLPLTLIKGRLMACGASMAADISAVCPSLLRKAIFPLSGTTLKEVAKESWTSHLKYFTQIGDENQVTILKLLNPLDWFLADRGEWINDYHGKSFKLSTPDGRELDAVWIPSAKKKTGNTPPEAAVMFHPNATTLDGMKSSMEFFKNRGKDVLMITMGGYPGSPQSQPTSESSAYQDVLGCINYLKGLGYSNTNLMAYGVSLGGTLAALFGVLVPGSHVISDQSLSSLRRVIHNLVEWPVKSPSATLPIKRLSKLLLPKGIPVAEGVVTDGFNSKKKIKQLKGKLLVIKSDNDRLMRMCPDHLTEAYAQTNPGIKAEDLLVTIPGTHGARFQNTAYAIEVVTQFLANINT